MKITSKKEKLTCTDPTVGQLLTEYEFGFLAKAEAERFEAHVFECLACADQLYEDGDLQPLIDLLDEVPLSEPAPAPKARGFGWWPAWRVPKPWALAASALFLLVMLYRPVLEPWWTYRQLSALAVPTTGYRGGSDGPPEVEPALERLAHEDVRGAAEILGRVIEKDPEAAEAAMYLGYCYLKLGQPQPAIAVLERAAEKGLYEDGWWLLAQAYLKAGQVEKALHTFDELSQNGHQHKEAARKAAAAIRRLAWRHAWSH